MTKPDLALPAPYEQYFANDEIAAGYEKLASTKLSTFVDEMEQAHRPGQMLADIRHPEEADSSEAVLHLNQWANPYKPSIHIGARAIQEFLPEPLRLLNFPNNTHNQHYYDLDARPNPHDVLVDLARKDLEAASRRGVEKAHIVGFSQGASVGAIALALAENYDIEVVSALLLDAPNNRPNRTEDELKKDFQGKGLENLLAFNQAVMDSGVPALAKAHGVKGKRGIPGQLLGFGGVLRDSWVKSNKLLQGAMATNTFEGDLRTARGRFISKYLPMPHVLAPVFEDSAIGTPGLEVEGVDEIIVPGYGHEGGDNIILMALLSRQARTGDKIAA